LVRAYLAGLITWDDVHRFAIEMEWTGTSGADIGEAPLEALYVAFLTADSKDATQFRKDKNEIRELVDDLDTLRKIQ
jgi:hypothetical protein